MVEIYTEILGFTAPSSLSAGATVNVRVQVKNASGVTGYAVCYVDGNPFVPGTTGITVGSGSAYLGPGASAWVDVMLWGIMPAWNFVLTARNYELTSKISRTIALTAATFSAQPLTVGKIGPITYSWTGFQAGYWIYVDTLSGPPEWGEGSYPVLGSIRLGDTSSGSLNTTAPGVAGTYVRQARQEVTGLKSNTITLVVTAAPPSAYIQEVLYWIEGMASWETLWSDPTGPVPVKSPNYSSRPAKTGELMYFGVGWFNTGDVPVLGHVDLELTAPISGAIYGLSAYEGQDQTRDPKTGSHVLFVGPLLNEAGTWKLKAVLRTTGATLDEMTTSFTVTAALPTSATATVRGKCTGGYPLPSMLLETYDKGVKIRSTLVRAAASIGIVYADSVVVTGAGIHRVQGRMVLTNPLGSYEFLTPAKEFTLG